MTRAAWIASLHRGGEPTLLDEPLEPYRRIQNNPDFLSAIASGDSFTKDRGGEPSFHHRRRGARDSVPFKLDSYVVIEDLVEDQAAGACRHVGDRTSRLVRARVRAPRARRNRRHERGRRARRGWRWSSDTRSRRLRASAPCRDRFDECRHGGLDALVFTGGVGENSASVRQHTSESLGFLGVAIDPGLNSRLAGDREISRNGAAVCAFVVMAREDLEIARQVRQVMAARGVGPPVP